MTYLSSKRKRFNPTMYKIADKTAKDCMIKYLTNLGHKVTPPIEKYGVDLHSKYKDTEYHHEVEMKFMWEGDWPTGWKDINIPFRKARLLDMVYGKDENANLSFYIIRGDCKQAWKMDGRVVEHSPVVEVPNRAVRKGEYFFKIPVEKAELLTLGE